jgi:large subunit ribosomal protein L24
MPIQVSNVMVVCPNCDKPTRIAHARLDDQHKTRVRVCRHCGEQLEVSS